MEIRSYREADELAVMALWVEAELTVPSNDPQSDIATYLASGQDLFFVAEDAPGVVGTAMAGFDGHRGWIYYLAVAAAYRRRGIGRDLVRHCESHLRARGCPKVNLMVRDGNRQAAAFYQSLGYEQSAVRTLGRPT